MRDEASFFCDYCNQENVIPIDVSEGTTQDYVEECAVCCRPNVVHVEIDDEGVPLVRSERAQDS